MRIDCCRKCGTLQEIKQKCSICFQAIKFECTTCLNESDEQIHSTCRLDVDNYLPLSHVA
ncbi:hypothetical protein C6990_09425 [Nitrosopumilus sp. b3]|uniref:hypothetical protein n=1 Tax=Nitrosopumilus sp. b3 TaxID=2109909 RepID=UPI0015F686E8|nr:hypothetical protein [Nitrosopumilus sp. b3]KAF6246340.1 hypothetical protein C6990_09425 [Nitrosopumilus sp. b3]